MQTETLFLFSFHKGKLYKDKLTQDVENNDPDETLSQQLLKSMLEVVEEGRLAGGEWKVLMEIVWPAVVLHQLHGDIFSMAVPFRSNTYQSFFADNQELAQELHNTVVGDSVSVYVEAMTRVAWYNYLVEEDFYVSIASKPQNFNLTPPSRTGPNQGWDNEAIEYYNSMVEKVKSECAAFNMHMPKSDKGKFKKRSDYFDFTSLLEDKKLTAKQMREEKAARRKVEMDYEISDADDDDGEQGVADGEDASGGEAVGSDDDDEGDDEAAGVAEGKDTAGGEVLVLEEDQDLGVGKHDEYQEEEDESNDGNNDDGGDLEEKQEMGEQEDSSGQSDDGDGDSDEVESEMESEHSEREPGGGADNGEEMV